MSKAYVECLPEAKTATSSFHPFELLGMEHAREDDEKVNANKCKTKTIISPLNIFLTANKVVWGTFMIAVLILIMTYIA